MIGFGANMLLAHADGGHGREALTALDFYAHADLFMNPTAEMADVVLPVASAFEREGAEDRLRDQPEAQSLIQLRPAVVPPPGEARPDTDIIFDLAARLGLASSSGTATSRPPTATSSRPTGVTLEQLRAAPAACGCRCRRATPSTPSRTRTARRAASPRRRARSSSTRRPFSITATRRCPSSRSRRSVPGAARSGGALPADPDQREADAVLPDPAPRAAEPAQARPDPEVELHPAAAQARGIANGDWVSIETPEGSVRARARLNDNLDPRVVVGEHGWWQACAEIGAPGYDPFGPTGANFNLLIGSAALDPVSGTASHRSYLCEIRPAID